MSSSVFKASELGAAIVMALLIEGGLVVLLTLAGAGTVLSSSEVPAEVIPIQITPVVEDLPALKLGGKPQKNKLPDMWSRKPRPKKRYEDKSAPAANADKAPKELPKNELAKSDETPAPEDAELAKKVDEDIVPEEEQPDPNINEEGEADGIVGGTETDPLKAFVVNQYKAKLIAWFKIGFAPRFQAQFCGIKVGVAANVAGDRTVTGFSIRSPSGNAAFDALVRSHMQSKVGRQLPPPPPKYPELGESIVQPVFQMDQKPCTNKSPVNDDSAESPGEPAPEEPTPEEPTPAEPAPEPEDLGE